MGSEATSVGEAPMRSGATCARTPARGASAAAAPISASARARETRPDIARLLRLGTGGGLGAVREMLTMLTPEQNERVTRIGAGTPMGEVFRRYWIPALLSAELP